MHTRPITSSLLCAEHCSPQLLLLYGCSLGVCCVWAASQLVGDKQREVEFVMRARHHMEYLFDSSHMEVAEGLMCMAYYSLSQVEWDNSRRSTKFPLFLLIRSTTHYIYSVVLIGSDDTIFVLPYLGKEHPEKTQCLWIWSVRLTINDDALLHKIRSQCVFPDLFGYCRFIFKSTVVQHFGSQRSNWRKTNYP